jgi:hypothetical protein
MCFYALMMVLVFMRFLCETCVLCPYLVKQPYLVKSLKISKIGMEENV